MKRWACNVNSRHKSKKISSPKRHSRARGHSRARRHSTANRTNPALWARIVSHIKAEAVAGTRAGEWSARKAQLAVLRYKQQGGRYRGRKSASNSLHKWSVQRWRTKSGKPSHITGERYLPDKAIKALSPREYASVSASKRRAMRQGKQYSRMPKRIASKVRKYRQ